MSETAEPNSGLDKVFQPTNDGNSIAEFSDFFDVSVPFLAYFVFYFVTATLIFRYVVDWQFFGIITHLKKKYNAGDCCLQLTSYLFFIYLVILPFVMALMWG